MAGIGMDSFRSRSTASGASSPSIRSGASTPPNTPLTPEIRTQIKQRADQFKSTFQEPGTVNGTHSDLHDSKMRALQNILKSTHRRLGLNEDGSARPGSNPSISSDERSRLESRKEAITNVLRYIESTKDTDHDASLIGLFGAHPDCTTNGIELGKGTSAIEVIVVKVKDEVIFLDMIGKDNNATLFSQTSTSAPKPQHKVDGFVSHLCAKASHYSTKQALNPPEIDHFFPSGESTFTPIASQPPYVPGVSVPFSMHPQPSQDSAVSMPMPFPILSSQSSQASPAPQPPHTLVQSQTSAFLAPATQATQAPATQAPAFPDVNPTDIFHREDVPTLHRTGSTPPVQDEDTSSLAGFEMEATAPVKQSLRPSSHTGMTGLPPVTGFHSQASTPTSATPLPPIESQPGEPVYTPRADQPSAEKFLYASVEGSGSPMAAPHTGSLLATSPTPSVPPSPHELTSRPPSAQSTAAHNQEEPVYSEIEPPPTRNEPHYTTVPLGYTSPHQVPLSQSAEVPPPVPTSPRPQYSLQIPSAQSTAAPGSVVYTAAEAHYAEPDVEQVGLYDAKGAEQLYTTPHPHAVAANQARRMAPIRPESGVYDDTAPGNVRPPIDSFLEEKRQIAASGGYGDQPITSPTSRPTSPQYTTVTTPTTREPLYDLAAPNPDSTAPVPTESVNPYDMASPGEKR